MTVTINGTGTASLDASGNLNLGSTGARITGEMTTATVANRLLFQTSTANSNTSMGAIPNGTGAQSGINFYNASDPTNASMMQIIVNNAEARLNANITGSGTYLPMTFYAGGAERARLKTDGYFVVNATEQNLGVGGSWGRVASMSNADGVNAFKGANSSATFSASLFLGATTRSANTSYSYYWGESNANGTFDTEFNLRGDGTGLCDGSWTGGGADYAEYFESATGAAIPVGTTVVLDGEKVRAATPDDPASAVIGVVRPKKNSAASAVIGNAAWNRWNGKFLTDDFGAYVMEDHDVIQWTDAEGNVQSYESHAVPAGVVVPDDASVLTHDDKGVRFQHRKLNPDFDPQVAYVPREDRDEWVVVGLVGQVPISNGQPIGDRWIKMSDRSETVSIYLVR